jgi:hypothetical protein
MDQEKVEISLGKLLPNILPDNVVDVAFDVRHTGPDEFKLYALFACEDEYWKSLDQINKAALLHDTKKKLRRKIKAYTNLNIEFDKDNTRMVNKTQFDRNK